MAELIDASNYQDFTLETLKTPDGITRLNGIIRQLSQNISGDTETVRVYSGVGTPEASVAAGIGSLYMRTDGSADTSVYRKESGSGDTGWVAIKAPAALPLSLANGGTGVALVDPDADRIIFWDDSAGQVTFLTAGSGLTITGTTLTSVLPGITLKSTTTVAAAASTGSITLVGGMSYKIIIKGIVVTNSDDLWLRFNADTGANYNYIRGGYSNGTDVANARTTGATKIVFNSSTIANSNGFEIVMDFIPNNDSANNKDVVATFRYQDSVNGLAHNYITGHYTGAAAITSFILLASTGNISATVWTYEYSGT